MIKEAKEREGAHPPVGWRRSGGGNFLHFSLVNVKRKDILGVYTVV